MEHFEGFGCGWLDEIMMRFDEYDKRQGNE
jgi:hypothetical protein